MREMNFFNPYIERKKPQRRKYIPATLGILIIVISAGWYGYNVYSIQKMKAEIETMNGFMASKENISKTHKYQVSERKIKALGEYQKIIDQLNRYTETASPIESTYFEALQSALPKNVFLQSLKADNKSVTIVGVSTDRVNIAEYTKNLKDLKLFDSVFVASITEDSTGTNLVFNLECKREGATQ